MSKPSKPKLPKVVETKLGRHKAHGLHWPGEIHIDPRLEPKRRLVVMIHEFMHERQPEWTEEKVEVESEAFGKFLWSHGYRRVDL